MITKLLTYFNYGLIIIIFLFFYITGNYSIYQISSNSMYPTLLEGDVVLCFKFINHRNIKNRDILIFKMPCYDHLDIDYYDEVFIKRCVKKAGEIVTCYKDYLLFKDTAQTYYVPKKGMNIELSKNLAFIYFTIIKAEDNFNHNKQGHIYTFKENYYFMLGDNNTMSFDSRSWGFLPEKNIIGKAKYILFSMDKNGSSKSKFKWNRFLKRIR